MAKRAIATSDALTRCAAAALVFLVAIVPFEWVCAEPYARAIVTVSAALADLTGPTQQVLRRADGSVVEVDRRVALQSFYADPEQRPRAYSVLAVWSWIAVAPLLALGARLRLAARAGLLIAAVYAVALTCDAVAWYWRSLAGEVGPEAAHWALAIGVLDGLGSALGMGALFVVPLLLGLAAYPGLALDGSDHRRATPARTARARRAG